MEQLESLLLDSISEDPEKAKNSISLFDDLYTKDPQALFSAFTEVILHSQNTLAVTLAIVNLSTQIRASDKEFVESKQQEVTEVMLAIYNNLSEHNMRYFAQLCVSVLSKFTDDTQIMLRIFGVFETESQKGLRCTLELLAGLEFTPTHELMNSWFQELLKVTLSALQHETTYYKSLAVRAVAMLLSVLPDQVEVMRDHLSLIKDEMANSLKMSQQEFEWFWNACDRLFRTGAISFEDFTDDGYLQVIMNATKREDIVPRLRVLPLMCLHLVFPYMDISEIKTISQFSVEMAALHWRQTKELPFHLIFFYEDVFDEFTHNGIFQMMKEAITALMRSGDKAFQVVGLCAIKVLMEKIPNYLYLVIADVNSDVERALKDGDPSLVEAACEIINVVPEVLARNFVDLGRFLPWVIMYMVHPDPSVRFLAADAASRIFELSRVPCPLAIEMMFHIMDKVLEEDQLRFLHVFAAAIEAQSTIEDEEAMKVVDLVQTLAKNAANDDYLMGSLLLAVRVMKNAECTREPLIPLVTELIRRGLATDNHYAICLCGSVLAVLLKVHQPFAVALFTEHKAKLEEIIDWDERYTRMKQQVLIALAHVNAVVGDHPLSEILFGIAVRWLKSPLPSEVMSALRMLKRGVLYRPDDQIVSVFKSIAELCCTTKEMNVACMCVTSMGYMIKKAKGDAKIQCTEIGYQMAIQYFLGELLVLNHIPPLSTDIDISLMVAFVKETSSLLVCPNDAQRSIFRFTVGVVARQNSLKTELVFSLWAEAVKHNAFLPEELQFIKDTALAYLVPDMAPELMDPVCYLMSSIVNANLVDWETMKSKMGVVKLWWNRGCELKHKMLSTMASMLELMLTIIGHYEQLLGTCSPVFVETILQQYPPADVKKTGQLTLAVIKVFGRQDVPAAIAVVAVKAIIRLLVCSPAVLVKRKVTPEMKQELMDIVKHLCSLDDEVRKVVREYAAAVPSRMDQLGVFLV